jgi:hypothetical protein
MLPHAQTHNSVPHEALVRMHIHQPQIPGHSLNGALMCLLSLLTVPLEQRALRVHVSREVLERLAKILLVE